MKAIGALFIGVATAVTLRVLYSSSNSNKSINSRHKTQSPKGTATDSERHHDDNKHEVFSMWGFSHAS